MMLPRIPALSAARFRTVVFGGYDRRCGAAEGSLRNGRNLSAADWPALGARRPRRRLETLSAPGGLLSCEGLYWVDGDGLYRDGELMGQLTEAGCKTLCAMGRRVLIFPDKLLYDPDAETMTPLENNVTVQCKFTDGTFAGEAAEANTLLASDSSYDWSEQFRVGDAVELSGAADPENNRSLIVREIEGPALRFYENSFTVNSTPADITVARTVPDLDGVFVNDNRVWGCKGDTIYASKLGDPFNWNVYDGLSGDSWTAQTGSAGAFTGCCAFLGYPCFFKAERVFKVYGSRPSNFELVGSASLGVAPGAQGSLAVADETLYYLSRAGIMAYGGGIPRCVSAPLGEGRFDKAVGGSDGLRYYVSLRDGADWSLFCYDPAQGLWQREDETEAIAFAFHEGALRMLTAEGELWALGETGSGGETEGPVESLAEFNDFTEDSPDRKHPAKLLLRLELEAGASLTVAVQYDSDGLWRPVAELTAQGKRSWYLPLLPRRCDHYRLRLTGRGKWRLLSLVRETHRGSAVSNCSAPASLGC